MEQTEKPRSIFRKLFRSPLFYLTILCCCMPGLWYLQYNPGCLFSLLPEPLYDRWEEFAALYMERTLRSISLFLLVSCIVFGLTAWGSNRLNLLQKIGTGLAYLILVFLLFMALTDSPIRERARSVNCISNLKQISLALMQYAGDYDDYLPPDLRLLAEAGYLYRDCFRCPSRLRPNQEFSDYLYYGAGRKLSDPPFLLLQDRDKNHPGSYYHNMFSDWQITSGPKEPAGQPPPEKR